MKFRLLLAGLLIAASASTALAAGPYVGISGGVSVFHDSDVAVDDGGSGKVSYKAGGAVNVGVGYNLDGLRLEGEFGYKKASADSLSAYGYNVSMENSDVSVTSYMANAYYDFTNTSAVTPFVGVGIGAVHGELSSPGFNESDTQFGYQLTAGLGFRMTKNVNLDLSYRFQGAANDFEIDGMKVGYGSSNFLAGLRYSF